MKWLRRFLRDPAEERQAELAAVQGRFVRFKRLLDGNKRVLQVIADLEEKSQGEHLFDINYIRSSRATLRRDTAELVENMIALGGERYAPLRERLAAIDGQIDRALEGHRPIPEDEYATPLSALDRSRADSVGGKSAQLGELGSLGLPVPEGFAVSAWAYKRFVDSNELQARISDHIRSLDIRRLEDLERASRSIQQMVTESEIPADLAEALSEAVEDLQARSGCGLLAVRSSALGEDALLSFAGQYASFLGVRPQQLLDRYRQVLAGKFNPQAIYYLLSHDLKEADLAMGVTCISMVDAAASGVVYTRDPVRADRPEVVVHSVLGLGPYVVDGTLTPDVFRLSREDGSVLEARVVPQAVRLILRQDGGTIEEPVPEPEREQPSLRPESLATLVRHADQVEAHYGVPQDIEWAQDRQGRLFLLQTRPLRVLRPAGCAEVLDVSGLRALRTDGTTVCCGAGAGPVRHVRGVHDLEAVEVGDVVLSPRPFPGLVTVMQRASAIVTEVGGVASHMATLAREYRVPTLAGVDGACDLPAGLPVTVDATGGSIYEGAHPALAKARRPEHELFEDNSIFQLLEKVLALVVPLNLRHPVAPEFRLERCTTLHDLTRFVHQKAMEEMFSGARETGERCQLGVLLETPIPLEVRLIDMDASAGEQDGRTHVAVDELESLPMKSFWAGVEEEGWPSHARPVNLSGFVSVVTTQMGTGSRQDFAEASFALVSREYMLLSLHLGYHFTTFESLCSPEPSKNYVRMQFKGGGASTDRRMRRIGLVMDLLARAGFEHATRGDFLDSSLTYADRERIVQALRLLGRLTMLTKQLDMALSNDSVAQWYTDDFARKLGLAATGEVR